MGSQAKDRVDTKMTKSKSEVAKLLEIISISDLTRKKLTNMKLYHVVYKKKMYIYIPYSTRHCIVKFSS